MQSFWNAKQHEQGATSYSATHDTFEPDAHYDTVVVGAGLTGLTTALLLTRAGHSVAVLEARNIGEGTTGKSTAKLSLLHGGALGEIHAHTSDTVLRAYVEGNREGQAWLLRYLEEHNVPVQFADAISYAITSQGEKALRKDASACKAAGLEIEVTGDIGLPFSIRNAITLADQAQFNPLDVLRTLAQDVRSRGALIAEGVRVQGVDTGEPCVIETDQGKVTANHVVLATGIPILDRGFYFAKLKPSRSYVAAFEYPFEAELPEGMFLSLDSPNRSIRTATLDGERWLLVGGNSHPVGRVASTQTMVDDLHGWTKRFFPDAKLTHAWSAQDYQSMNRIPFVGRLPRSGGKVSIATGFNKWGMTNAVTAALNIAADLLGGNLPWADTMHHRITRPQDLSSAIVFNAEVAALLATGWGEAELSPLPKTPPAEGTGTVGQEQLKPVAVSKVNGKVCKFSAICPHLGGILTWNDAEHSWDCPLHGSRFDAEGKLLEGPATTNLRRLD